MLPAGEALELSVDHAYKFDATRGPIALERIVVGDRTLRDSFGEAGLGAAALDQLEHAGFSLTPTGESVVARAGRCLDWAYNELYYVDTDGSVETKQVWFCRDWWNG